MTSEARAGVAYALAAYASWGVCPIYFKAVKAAPALEVLGHRVVFGALLLAGLLWRRGQWGEVRAALGRRAAMGRLGLTTCLIAFNWYLFIWAVANGHIVEASMGYFINPLMSVAMGVLLLGERVTRAQVVAIALAAAGVLVLTLSAGKPPWVSLALAGSFGLYGLLRKGSSVGALPGLAIETGMMLLPAIGLLGWMMRGERAVFLTGSAAMDVLLPLAAVVTVMPLLWFTEGARRVRLSTLGLLQYTSPSMQMMLGVFVYGEHFSGAHGVALALIWAGLGVFTYEALSRVRRDQRERRAETARVREAA